MDVSQAFLYGPLPYPNPKCTIRILIVLPGTFEREIYCHLSYLNIGSYNDVDFEALSYAWGEPRFTHSIKLGKQMLDFPESASKNGEFHDFPVTHTLYCALKQLRFETKPRRLWIDAVCIDQNNIEERNQQVPIMGKVYSSAISVLVWLGDYTEPMFQDSTKLCEKSVSAAFKYVAKLSSYGLNLAELPLLPSLHVSNLVLEVLMDIYRRPWFQRLWVLQEVILPQSCYCILRERIR
ncbi:HET-domain-containing protein [Lojkania enalia]|uniref:HET-domain-containing protein n=1 Tax=Lojkania enalia TaxID=147567 RepID=A0A9P4K110_9PLEO|nr:HET-domain-containing protein [Didymosphaeria enalia]